MRAGRRPARPSARRRSAPARRSARSRAPAGLLDDDFGRRRRHHVLRDVAGAARRSDRHAQNDQSGCRHCPNLVPGKTLSQAGQCSRNRQITVNAILTIVINLKFMRMLAIGRGARSRGHAEQALPSVIGRRDAPAPRPSAASRIGDEAADAERDAVGNAALGVRRNCAGTCSGRCKRQAPSRDRRGSPASAAPPRNADATRYSTRWMLKPIQTAVAASSLASPPPMPPSANRPKVTASTSAPAAKCQP